MPEISRSAQTEPAGASLNCSVAALVNFVAIYLTALLRYKNVLKEENHPNSRPIRPSSRVRPLFILENVSFALICVENVS